MEGIQWTGGHSPLDGCVWVFFQTSLIPAQDRFYFGLRPESFRFRGKERGCAKIYYAMPTYESRP